MAIAGRIYSGFSVAGFTSLHCSFAHLFAQVIMVAISCGVGKTYVVTNTTTDYTGQCKYCPKEIETKCKLQGRPVSTIECNCMRGRCCGRMVLNPSPPITRECQAGDIDQSFPATATPPYNCGRCQDGCKSNVSS
ncbi:hypothetical protein MKW92_003980 [Papaver armeniacum]|nr:hypothetical protein MKW92_003980 [Papaver armeniacum]